ncbi:type II toxin-antitoxin system Phd/YefM family antitoxin [Testudinibacter sp. P80/BLE/0925]|uniref:type II toxin-antitoxin system Phd/YefM family antitoxin n=1 Tax=Testudinibacter sp. TW-1 TaxID=3417757 RepID=UPI003D366BBD
MESINANQAQTHFNHMLLKVQNDTLQINQGGKAVAVMMSMAEYENIEWLKLQLLQQRAQQAQHDICHQRLISGDDFFNALNNGEYDD